MWKNLFKPGKKMLTPVTSYRRNSVTWIREGLKLNILQPKIFFQIRFWEPESSLRDTTSSKSHRASGDWVLNFFFEHNKIVWEYLRGEWNAHTLLEPLNMPLNRKIFFISYSNSPLVYDTNYIEFVCSVGNSLSSDKKR